MLAFLKSPWFEKVWPCGFGIVVVILWWCAGSPFPTASKADSLFGTAATVSSVFASFLGVSKAIILSMKDGEVYKALKKENYTDPLFLYLKAGIRASVVFAALSILGFFICPGTEVLHHDLFDFFSAIWVLFGALALFTYMRISNILFKLLRAA